MSNGSADSAEFPSEWYAERLRRESTQALHMRRSSIQGEQIKCHAIIGFSADEQLSRIMQADVAEFNVKLELIDKELARR